MSNIDLSQANPWHLIQKTLSEVESKEVGTPKLVDLNNPVAQLLEMSIQLSANNLSAVYDTLVNTHPSLAQTTEQLYRHMSDVDHIGRHARPGNANFRLVFFIGELVQYGHVLSDGTRQITLPKDTEITIADYVFTNSHPIDIFVDSNGYVTAYYRITERNPLKPIATNFIDTSIFDTPISDDDQIVEKTLMLEVNFDQFQILSQEDQLNLSSMYKKRFDFEDQFYHIEIYKLDEQKNEWVPIRVSFSHDVYSISELTAIVSVFDDQVEVKIPKVYYTTAMVPRTIRVDVFTTKGDVTQLLERFEPKSYSIEFNDRRNLIEPSVNAIRRVPTVKLFSPDTLTGGRSELSFELLKERVISRSVGDNSVPITQAQLHALIQDRGFDITNDVDTTTRRLFKATRELPNPDTLPLLSPIGSTVVPLVSNIGSLKRVNSKKIIQQGINGVVKANALFKLENDRLTLLGNNEVQTIANLQGEALVNYLLRNRIVTNPFDYVYDTTSKGFIVRPYYFSSPDIDQRYFIEHNVTTEINISTLRVAISRVPTGFEIVIMTESTDDVKEKANDEVHCRLGFRPKRENQDAYLNSYAVQRTADGEYIFRFSITTDFWVNENHELQLTSFSVYDEMPTNVLTDLMVDMDIYYYVTNHTASNIVKGDIDVSMGTINIPNNSVAVTHNRMRVKLGTNMSLLWAKCNTLIGQMDYEYHEADVPYVYEQTEYEREDDGTLKVVEQNGTLDFVVKHAKGTVKVDTNGNTVFRYRKGDIKLHPITNEPIIARNRDLVRFVEFFVVDALFILSKNTRMLNYYNDVVKQIEKWLTGTLVDIDGRLLENTNLWFYPKVTIGNVAIIADDNMRTSIPSEQTLSIKYYVNNLTLQNNQLRQALIDVARQTVADHFKKRTITVTDIATDIKQQTQNDVFDVRVFGLGGNDYSVITLLNDSDNLTIRKRPLLQPDGSISVAEDVVVEFELHK